MVEGLLLWLTFVCPPQQEAEGEHQRPDEDGAETGAGNDSQEHRGGSEAPHSGDLKRFQRSQTISCIQQENL